MKKRDVFTIYEKVVITLSGSGNYEKIRKEWDLWGPLMISLITACICAFSTAGSSE